MSGVPFIDSYLKFSLIFHNFVGRIGIDTLPGLLHGMQTLIVSCFHKRIFREKNQQEMYDSEIYKAEKKTKKNSLILIDMLFPMYIVWLLR